MKLKTKNLVAFAATCALGAAAITGVAFGASAMLNNNVYPHADAEIVEPLDDEATELTQLTVGSNSVNITAGETTYAAVVYSGKTVLVEDVNEEGEEVTLEVKERAQAGNYTFSSTSKNACELMCTVDGEVVTYTLGSRYAPVTIYMEYPMTTVLELTCASSTTLPLNISYTPVDDVIVSDGTLVVGNNQVTTDWFGDYYTFTAEKAGTYVLNCTDKNAFILVETEYGEEQILWDWVEDENEEGVFEEVYTPFVFTLAEGETYTFLMACNDVDEATGTATYIVNIALKAE